MAARWLTPTLVVLVLFSTMFHQGRSGKTCNYEVGGNNFSISNWVWSVPAGNATLSVSFCSPLPKCNGASICRIGPDGTDKISLGKKDSSIMSAIAQDHSGFSVIYNNGDQCIVDKTKNHKSEVYFICGKTLGNLEFVEDNGCTSVFEFTTSEACSNNKKVNEIPCTLIDKDKKLRDLTQLVKTKGAHQVTSAEFPDFYVNVCREITGDVEPGKKCPKGSSSCANGKNFGQIVEFSKLQLVNDYTISLKYANKTGGCSTNITFVCPKAISQVGGRGPVMQSSSLCHYEILWETEHACPIDDQVSNNCTVATKDGLFDLSPLKRQPENYYKVRYQDPKSKRNYDYFLNICGGMKNFDCGKNSTDIAVCQTQREGPAKKTGDSKYMKLRYVDGQLILTYKHGETCSSGIRRSTILTFYCNESANQGSPLFNHEDYCNYFFDWPTRLVCPRARKTGNECRVITPTNHIYDLTELIKTGSDNWHVDDATSSALDKMYINVCGAVRSNSVTRGCPANNAACIVLGDKAVGLGKFESKLTSDAKNSLRLVYSNGSTCDGSRRRISVLTFICHPGKLSNAPVLISKSPDDCDYEFVWQTGAACPLGKRIGSNCQVSDPVAGYSFDLTPLSNARPVQGKDYFSEMDSRKEYEYQIKICEGSSKTKCSANGKLIGACQYKPSSQLSKTMGIANSNLVYFDGLIKLSYLHGDKCRNGQFRETHVTFICDENAGIGHPQFEKEVACGTYNFLWYTKHACHSKIVECSVFDAKNNRHYDLSRLSSNHGWQATNGSAKYYINVCRPVYKRPVGCSIFSAICKVQVSSKGVETFLQDLGSISESPSIESNGDLVIVYQNGSWCGKNKRVTSKIRFICKSGGGEGSPEFDASASDGCNIVFRWETSYACPVGDSSSGSVGTCTVQDPVSRYTFNLSPLRRSSGFYHVKSGSDSYVVNICGNVSGSGCNELGSGYQAAACKLTGQKGKNPVIGSLSQQLKYSMGQLILEYSKGERQDDGYEYKATITFLCNKNIPLGSPKFDHFADRTFYFTFETSLACSPEPVQCRIAGPGNVMYNLEPLIKQKGFWTALNRETSGQKHHYFINVCQALDVSPPACPKNAIAACQVDFNSKRQIGHSIGYVSSNPQVNEKTLSIQYRNGEFCHHGNRNRSVRILFHCSSNEGSPVFQSETKECGYIFNWLTPAACPRVNTEGGNCKVEDPVYKHVFDLSKIPVREITVNSSKFLINACGKTECGNFGACLKSGTKSRNIGNVNTMAHLLNGDLYIEYTNGEIKTKVRFVCDRKEDTLSFTTSTNGKGLTEIARYDFEWKTPLACLPHYNVECSLFVNGNGEDEMYDLSVLSRWDANWRAHIDTDRVGYPVNRKIFINVCRNIVKGSGAEDCPDGSGICMLRGSEKLNLGFLTRGPYKDGSFIVLEYTNGDVCNGKERFSAKIRVQSNGDESGLGEPVLVGVQGCVHMFTWVTSAAKPINKQKKPLGTDCKVVNPLTGNLIDLSIFKDKAEVRVNDDRGGYFMIKICSSFKEQNLRSKCGASSGVCRLTESNVNYKMNAGNFNEKIIYDKVLSLKYSDGDICPRCKCKRETIVNFVCAPEEGYGSPVLLSQLEDCTQLFVWRTRHVCEREVQCTAFGDLKTFNIGHLSQSTGNHQISMSNTKYFINICKNLQYDKLNPCPVGAAACQITTINGKRSIQSLGEITAPPVMNNDKTVTLTYENGESCDSDKSRKWKTIIIFICERGKKGHPVFKSCDDCICNFEWKTFEVCDEDEKIDETKCTVKDENSNHFFDLSPLKILNHGNYKVKSKYPGISYFVNVCSVTSVTDDNCKDSGVCRAEKANGKTVYRSLGSVKYQKLVFDTVTNTLNLKYLQDSDGTQIPTSMITFQCDELVGKGQPRLITDVQSHSLRFFAFHWRTSIVCTPVDVPLFTKFNGKDFSLKLFSQNSESFVAEDRHYIYTLNFYGGIKDGKNGCPKTAAVCRTSKTGDEVRVLAPASKQNISANSTNVMVDFTGGKGSCSNAKVRVVIKCDHDDDDDKKLIFSSFDQDECFYHFVFNSKLICRKSDKQSHSSMTKKSQGSKSHAVAIVIVVIAVLAILLASVYVLINPERRANTISRVRFSCKKYICCKSLVTPGYKYKKVRVSYAGDDIEEREGLLVEDSDNRTDNVYKDSDSENEDDELLTL